MPITSYPLVSLSLLNSLSSFLSTPLFFYGFPLPTLPPFTSLPLPPSCHRSLLSSIFTFSLFSCLTFYYFIALSLLLFHISPPFTPLHSALLHLPIHQHILHYCNWKLFSLLNLGQEIKNFASKLKKNEKMKKTSQEKNWFWIARFFLAKKEKLYEIKSFVCMPFFIFLFISYHIISYHIIAWVEYASHSIIITVIIINIFGIYHWFVNKIQTSLLPFFLPSFLDPTINRSIILRWLPFLSFSLLHLLKKEQERREQFSEVWGEGCVDELLFHPIGPIQPGHPAPYFFFFFRKFF